MTATMHKILKRGGKRNYYAILTVGQLSEEAAEVRNKQAKCNKIITGKLKYEHIKQASAQFSFFAEQYQKV